MVVGVLVATFGLALGIVLYRTFDGIAPLVDGARIGPATTVVDGYVASFLLEAGDGQVVLIDAGQEEDAAPILAALRRAGHDADDVTAVLLTHGHSDHRGGLGRFPNAALYAHEDELPLLRGEVSARGPVTQLSGRQAPLRIQHPVRDGQELTLGALHVRALHVPGHTAGSLAWLVDDVLFMGDNGHSMQNGDIEPAPWIFTDDTSQNRDSLAALAERVDALSVPVETLVFSHSAPLSGTAPLTAFAARHRARR